MHDYKQDEARLTFYKTHPEQCDPDDLWGQVMRTVNGKPVPEEQINLIIEFVVRSLNLHKEDVLLDLCCGNGALTDRLFNFCAGGVGIDFSEPLISIANKKFHKENQRDYFLSDIEDFLNKENTCHQYTKAICYGSFMYLTEKKALNVLKLLCEKFTGVEKFLIGNLPDKNKIETFAKNRGVEKIIADDPAEPFGIWRTKREFSKMANMAGWNVTFSEMPENFYSAGYRYDALLIRQ